MTGQTAKWQQQPAFFQECPVCKERAAPIGIKILLGAFCWANCLACKSRLRVSWKDAGIWLGIALAVSAAEIVAMPVPDEEVSRSITAVMMVGYAAWFWTRSYIPWPRPGHQPVLASPSVPSVGPQAVLPVQVHSPAAPPLAATGPSVFAPSFDAAPREPATPRAAPRRVVKSNGSMFDDIR